MRACICLSINHYTDELVQLFLSLTVSIKGGEDAAPAPLLHTVFLDVSHNMRRSELLGGGLRFLSAFPVYNMLTSAIYFTV